MIPPRFDYVAPTALDEAIAAVADGGEDAKILSGGQSLLPLLKMRLAAPRLLVDINRVPGLDHLHESDGALRIGALVREAELERSEFIRTRYPLLADAAAVVADPLVRNLATVCGNLAHADPANDHPAAMLALEATVAARGPAGEREIPVTSFFTGLFATALAPDEVLTEIRVPIPQPRSGGAYLKLERKVGDFATAAVAVQVTLGEDGVCRRGGIGLTNVGMVPIKARTAEEYLLGRELTEDVVREAAKRAASEARPASDHRGSEAYKRDLVRVLTMRALRLARQRAEGRAPTGSVERSADHRSAGGAES